MRKTYLRFMPFAIFLVGLLIWESSATTLISQTEHLYAKVKVFTSIIETIQRVYLEKRDADVLIEDAIDGMLANLDPHTSYLSPEEYIAWHQNFEGYTGIGISFEVIKGRPVVMSVVELGPAERSGICPGDHLIAIDGVATTGLPAERVAEQLRGPSGSIVTVKIQNERWATARELRIKRQKILLSSVSRALMLNSDVGYVKIERFTASTNTDLDQALDRLRSLGMKRLILDLRGNSGGYMNAAIEVADKFIPGGHKLLSTRGRLQANYQVYYSTEEATWPLWPLVVLIDHGTASASEIVAGAIQDLDRGLLIGKASFGKGLVQSQYRFQDGSALLITTAQYYTPSGRAIQRDYTHKSRDQYYREAYGGRVRTSNESDASKSYQTVSGRTVYGSGGICPDIVLENDHNHLSENVRHLLFEQDRHFYAFCRKLLSEGRSTLNKVQFLANFSVPDRLCAKFLSYVQAESPGFRDIDFVEDIEDIKFLLKRELAYLVWGRDMRFRVNIERDEELRQALRNFAMAERLLASANYSPSFTHQILLKK